MRSGLSRHSRLCQGQPGFRENPVLDGGVWPASVGKGRHPHTSQISPSPSRPGVGTHKGSEARAEMVRGTGETG